MPNLKIVELASSRPGIDGDLPDPPFHSLGDGRHEPAQFCRRGFGDHFHPAIGQIPHKACDFKSRGQTPGRFAKADPLDMAAVKSLPSFDRRCVLVARTHEQCQSPNIKATGSAGGFNR